MKTAAPVAPRGRLHLCVPVYSAASADAPLSRSHTFCGVAGMSTWVMPAGSSASASAFIVAGAEPTAPASPAPLTPSGLVLHGTRSAERRVGNESDSTCKSRWVPDL